MKHATMGLALAGTLIAMSRLVSAQTPPPGMVSCAHVGDPAERLRCYDSQMSAMGVVVGNPPPTTPAIPSTPSLMPPPGVAAPLPPAVAAAPASQSRFGLEDLKQAQRPKENPNDRVLLSTIASIKEARPKLWIIVLANGQIWMQEGTSITSFFKAGFEARIEKGLLGDYRMATTQTGEKNMVRVTRVQ